jgi:hypothetical protein
MDVVVKIAGWASLVFSVIAIFLGPSLIGKERGPFTSGEYTISLINKILVILLVGRCLGWW